MQQRDVRFALAARADGMRQVRRLTAGIGVAALAGSAVVAVVLSHLPGASAAAARAAARSAAGSAAQSGSGTAGSGATGSGQTAGGSSSGQGTDGGSGQTAGGGSSGTRDGASLQAPAQNLTPSAGLPQSVSGGS